MAVSISSMCLLRSSYSTVSFFFTMSTSLTDLAISTRQFFSMLALSLMASSCYFDFREVENVCCPKKYLDAT